jgi:hypothetical protein
VVNAPIRRPARGAARLVATIAFLGEPVAAQQVIYSGSLSYSTGSYVFVDRTHSVWLSNGLTLRAGPASFSASLPLIAQNSGVVSFVAGQPVPTGGENSEAVRRREGGKIGSGGSGGQSGATDSTVVFRDAFEVQFGDPMVFGSFETYSGAGFLRSASVVGGAKAPLRTLESGVGTGEWDFGAGASLVVGSGYTLGLVDVTYWWFGDLPDLELAGSLLYSVAVSRAVMDARGSVVATLAGGTSIIESVDPPVSLGLGFLYAPRSGRSVSVGAHVGLSEGAPDFSTYLGWSLRL